MTRQQLEGSGVEVVGASSLRDALEAVFMVVDG